MYFFNYYQNLLILIKSNKNKFVLFLRVYTKSTFVFLCKNHRFIVYIKAILYFVIIKLEKEILSDKVYNMNIYSKSYVYYFLGFSFGLVNVSWNKNVIGSHKENLMIKIHRYLLWVSYLIFSSYYGIFEYSTESDRISEREERNLVRNPFINSAKICHALKLILHHQGKYSETANILQFLATISHI